MFVLDGTTRYFCYSEEEAQSEFENFKQDVTCEIVKHTIQKKEKKSKGEVIFTWWVLTVVRKFNDEKDGLPGNEDS